MTQTTASIETRFLPRPLWWLFFALDTFVLSLCFQGFKVFTLHPDPVNGVKWLGALALFAGCSALLVFDSYANERAQAKVQNRVWPFEWLYQAREKARQKRMLFPQVQP